MLSVRLPSVLPPPVRPPLYVGLSARWDGEGYIRGEDYLYTVGMHLARDLDGMTDADTIRDHPSHPSAHHYTPATLPRKIVKPKGHRMFGLFGMGQKPRSRLGQCVSGGAFRKKPRPDIGFQPGDATPHRRGVALQYLACR